MKKFALAAAAAAATFTAAAPAAHASHKREPVAACANKFCTKDRPGIPSCHRFKQDTQVARCFIKRAAAHYHQDQSLALAISYRESHWHPKATNSSSGAAGLYQFMPTTWQNSPYGKHHSAYQPRWAALGAMWYWSHGGYYHWSL
jgi:hypothetical protein